MCFTNINLLGPHNNSKSGTTIILIFLKIGKDLLAEGSTGRESMF